MTLAAGSLNTGDGGSAQSLLILVIQNAALTEYAEAPVHLLGALVTASVGRDHQPDDATPRFSNPVGVPFFSKDSHFQRVNDNLETPKVMDNGIVSTRRQAIELDL